MQKEGSAVESVLLLWLVEAEGRYARKSQTPASAYSRRASIVFVGLLVGEGPSHRPC